MRTWEHSLQGIFTTAVYPSGASPLKDMNVAYVRSCSNDAFMGDRGPQKGGDSKSVLSWHFRGMKIVEATFADLRSRTGLGEQLGDRVVLGGCGSGARGAAVLLDHVARAHVGLAEVAGLLDSALRVPLRPHAKGLVPAEEQARRFFSWAKPKAEVLGMDCAANRPRAQQWRCLEVAQRLPFIAAPFFMLHSQYDLHAISESLFGRVEAQRQLDPPQRQYAEEYRSKVTSYLPTPANDSGSAVFSPACYAHCTLSSQAFFRTKADGELLIDALWRWLSAPSSQEAVRSVRERCRGFDCGRAGDQAVLTAHEWEPRFLKDYPFAVCNDGSPAAYYYRPGDKESQRWLVFLEGAGWCWDSESCSAPMQTRHSTSNFFPKTRDEVRRWSAVLQGVLETSDRSPFKDWHLAYVRACSNDAFLGDSSPQEAAAAKIHKPGSGWHFRGRRILEATFEDLRRHSGLGSNADQMVVYGGVGSGADGALVTLDDVAGVLVGKAKVRGLLDAPLAALIRPNRSGILPHGKQVLTQANVNWPRSTDCEASLSTAHRWKCVVPVEQLPVVHTPYFLANAQYDSMGVASSIFSVFLPGMELSPEQQVFVERFRHDVLRYLPTPSASSGVAVFAPASYVHGMFSEEVFYKIEADGVTLQTALRRWLGDRGDPNAAHVDLRDDCEGFNCGWKTRQSADAKSMTL